MKTARLVSVYALGMSLVLVGCGKKDTASSNDTTTTASTTSNQQKASSTATASTPASGRAIEVTGNDAMKFSLTEMRAKPGETLSVTLSNIGTMPKLSMGHNWVLLKKSAALDTFVTDAMQAATTDYIPMARKDDMLAHTKLLGPKEKDTVTFQAPKEPGSYPFLCTFPGHYQVGMKGVLIVE